MPVEQQVQIIFAISNGFIDDVPVAQVRDWEAGFHTYMKAQFPQVGDAIRKDKIVSKETEAELRRGIEQYKNSR
jgi:F-type H+-transporting ATPase subunit alpha